tara:strand:- start:339 stop:593 length:255 start_codon:yes stop_codon:yes gene_type:complete
MNKFNKWLFQNVKRKYKVSYLATGFMGNRYCVGTFEFKVTDRHLKNCGVNSHSYGFILNKASLAKHFKIRKNGNITFLSADIKE